MPRRISTFEVIEDSEPEREERRRQGIGEDMASIKKRTGGNATNAKTATSVLELSDDNYAGRLQAIPTPIISDPMLLVTNSIIDISDDEVPTRNDQQQNTTVDSDAPKHNAVSASTAPKVPPFSSSRDNALAVSSDSEHDREEEDRMKLGRFAYLNPSRSNSRAALSRSNSIPATDKKLPEPAPKNRPARPKPQHRFTSDFTELELTRLVKCISCDIRWTTRKGVAQKMTHIQSCAKKNALTDDTVKTLIRKDIDKAIAGTPTVPNPAKKGKGKGVEDATPLAPKTVLEEVVEGTETKRKGRRVEVVETVKDALEIRGVILDRARTVLGERVIQNTQEGLNRQPTQGFATSRVLARLDQGMGTGQEAVPTTQVFGKSALGQRQAHKMGLGETLDQQPLFQHENRQNEDIEAPLATQGFAPSRLGGLHRPLVKPRSTMQYGSPPGSPSRARRSPCSQSSSNASLSIIDLVSSSSRDPSPQTHPNGGYAEALPHFTSPPQHPLQPLSLSSPEKVPALRAQQVNEQIEEQHTYEYALDGDGDGDAFLHYDPILENPQTHIIQDQSLYHELPHTGHIDYGTHPSPATNQRVSKPRRSSSSSSEGPTARITVKKSARSRGKQLAKKDKPLLDDEWERELKSRILRDETLHLRILRYEPLPFDIFLAMVATDDKPSGKLKLALRTFLDKQAINFYGAELSRRR